MSTSPDDPKTNKQPRKELLIGGSNNSYGPDSSINPDRNNSRSGAVSNSIPRTNAEMAQLVDNTAWLDSILDYLLDPYITASPYSNAFNEKAKVVAKQAILSHLGASEVTQSQLKPETSKSLPEMREQIMELLGLEQDLQGQIVLRDIEDVQSNWEYVVEAILSYIGEQGALATSGDASTAISKQADNLVPESVKGTGFFTPMDIAPGEYEVVNPNDVHVHVCACGKRWNATEKPTPLPEAPSKRNQHN